MNKVFARAVLQEQYPTVNPMPLLPILSCKRSMLSFICFVELKYVFIFRQKVDVELKNGTFTLQTGPLCRGFTMRLALRFCQGLEKVSVLENVHFKEWSLM